MSNKKKYHDQPRFKAINGYEDEFKKQYSLQLRLGIKALTKAIKNVHS